MLFSLNNDTLRLFLAKNIFVQEIIYATPLCVFPCRFLQIFYPFKVPRRSQPAKYGEGFDAPPTLERSGSEHQRAWEWVKDPPAGEGQVGQIQHCRAVFLFFPEGRRPR